MVATDAKYEYIYFLNAEESEIRYIASLLHDHVFFVSYYCIIVKNKGVSVELFRAVCSPGNHLEVLPNIRVQLYTRPFFVLEYPLAFGACALTQLHLLQI